MSYVKKNRHDPLYFYKYFGIEKLDDRYQKPETWYKDDMTLSEMVVAILQMARSFGSANKKGMETTPGRRRSSLDIWRHVIAVRPDVDIFSVMEAMYSIHRNLNFSYCYVVMRAVFTFREMALTDEQLSRFNPSNLLCKEYGILFSSWKKLS